MNSSEKQNPKITPCYPHVIPWFHCPSLSGATRLGHGGGAGLGAAGRRGFGRGECAEAQGRPRGGPEAQGWDGAWNIDRFRFL